MARKTIGYTELEWICENCKTRNPGTEKNCGSCGSPQPDDVVFVEARQQGLLKDEEKIQAAKAGADIHCGFCGTRNSASEKNCSQCGGELAAGERRISGMVVGAFDPEKKAELWTCKNCQFENPPINNYCRQCGSPHAEKETPPIAETSGESLDKQSQQLPMKQKKKRKLLIPIVIIIVFSILMIFLIATLSKTKDLIGRVQNVQWSRAVEVESYVTVNRETWQDQVPSAGVIGSCELRFYNEQDQPAAQSTEVCGTPYMLDLGNGNAEVVQDCTYRVYEPYCSYAIDTWQVTDSLEANGNDLLPIWPEIALNQNQRYGNQKADYSINFDTSEGVYTFSTDNVDLFTRCKPGSRWEITLNAFDRITSIQPLQ